MTVQVIERKGGLRIVGSGGGGKGGGGSARTPVESPDSLHNTAYAVLLDVIGNGEMVGPVHADAPLKDVFLDGTPIQNEDGTLNFQDVHVEVRHGTQSQEHISGFPTSASVTNVGVEVKTNQPWTQQITNPDLSAVRVTLHWPQLMQLVDQGDNAGDRVGFRVDYAIDLAIGSGAYVEQVSSSVDGKSVNGYSRTHRIELPEGNLGWRVRVRRLSESPNVSNIQDKMLVQSYAEVIDGKFRYPMTALVGIKVSAEQFQSIPTRAFRWKGQIIRVPSNYDPINRTYAGAWGGTFKRAWSNNPAWVYYDILMNKLYGLGERVDASMIDRYTLYQIGAYCDQLVSDGQGGQEPRFTCTTYIQGKADALRVLNDLTSVFRGMAYWANGQIVAVADAPSDPVYTYTNANVENGRFEYTGADISTRKTVALVSWNDPTDFYRAKVEVVNDDDGIRRYGVRKTEITAFGATTRGQAQRAGLYALYTSRMETGGIAFSVGLDGVIPQPGSIVKVADKNRAGRAIGGRIRQSSGNSVMVDRAVIANVGDRLTVILPNGKPQTRTIVGKSGRTLTVNPGYSQTPKSQSVWALDSNELSTQYARVVSISERDGITYDIAAVSHHPGKFGAIDSGVRLDPLPITVVPPRTQRAPTNIQISDYVTVHQGTTRHSADISWDEVEHALTYDVQWRRDNGDWVGMPRTGSRSVQLDDIYSGMYTARVRAINALDVPSLWGYSEPTNLEGVFGEPPVLAGLFADGIVFGINLRWIFPDGPNIFSKTEIRYSQSAEFNSSILLGEYSYPTNTHTLMGLAAGRRFFFWARLVDKNGFAGLWFPSEDQEGVMGESSWDADDILDYLEGEIGLKEFDEWVREKIEAVPNIVGDIKDIDANIDRIDTNLADVNTNIDRIDSTLEPIASDINRIDANIDRIDTSITTIEGGLIDMGVELDLIGSQVADLLGVGDWDAESEYLEGSLVSFEGALYRAMQDVPVGTLLTDQAYWKKVGDYASIGEAVVGLAARIEQTNQRVDAVDGKIEVVSSDQNMLAAQIRSNEDDGEGRLEDVLNSFTSRAYIAENREAIVTEAEARVESTRALGAEIGENKAQIAQVEQALVDSDSAQATVNQQIISKVDSNTAEIQSTQQTIVDKEQAQAIVNDALQSNIDSNTAEIATTKQTIVDVESAQSTVNQTIISSVEDNSAAISLTQQTVVDNEMAQSERNDIINARIDSNVSEIATTQQTVADNKSAQALENQSLVSAIGDNAAEIDTVKQTIVDSDSAQASINQTLTSQIEENQSQISTTQQTIATDKAAQADVNQSLTSAIGDNAAQISATQQTIVDDRQAQATVNDSLASQIADNVSAINTNQQTIADVESAQAIVNQQIISAVDDNAAEIVSVKQTAVDDKSAQAAVNDSLASQIGESHSLITTTQQTVADNASAQADVNESILSAVGDNAAEIASTKQTIADNEQAQATVNDSVVAQLEDQQAGITENREVITKVGEQAETTANRTMTITAQLLADDGEGQLAGVLNEYTSRAFIRENQVAIATEEEARVESERILAAEIDDARSQIKNVEEVVATNESTQATVNENLLSAIDENASEIDITKQTIVGVEQAQSIVNERLTSQFEDNQSEINTVKQTIADDKSAQAQINQTLTSAIDDNAAQIGTTQQTIVNEKQAQALVNQDLTAKFDDNAAQILDVRDVIADDKSAQATINQSLNTRIEDAESSIGTVQQTITDDKQAQAIVNQQLNSAVGDNASQIDTIKQTHATDKSSQATINQQLTTKTTQNAAAVSTVYSAVASLEGELSAEWGVRTQVYRGSQRYVSGIQLGVATRPGQSTQSYFNVAADVFRIVNLTNNTAHIPFAVVNGQVLIREAFIGSASITNAKIKDGAITNAKISGNLYSANFDGWQGTKGWQLSQNGELHANQGYFRGNLHAANGTFSGQLTAQAVNAVRTINIAGHSVSIQSNIGGPGNIVINAPYGGQATVTLNLDGDFILHQSNFGTLSRRIAVKRNGVDVYVRSADAWVERITADPPMYRHTRMGVSASFTTDLVAGGNTINFEHVSGATVVFTMR